MTGLSLHLLGPPEALRDGVACRLGAKSLAVLAYLALEGRSGRRELARMLWPEASDPLNSLSAARTAIVRALGEGALDSDPDTLALSRGWAVDAQGFAQDRAETAWSLWTGPLLDGFRLPEWEQGLGEEFEAWLYARRESLGEARRGHALTLAASALNAGEVAAALPYLEIAAGDGGGGGGRAGGGEPREDVARLQLLALGALERPGQATAVYHQLCEDLRTELGVDPTTATTEAFNLVRGGHARACLNALHRELTGAAPASLASALSLPSGEEERVPLIGRDEALRALRERLAPVLDGRRLSASVLILGEPGEGKTRLAREYAARLARQRVPHRLLYGQATQGGAPLQLFERAVRDALKADPTSLEDLNPAWRAALAQMLPDLAAPEGAQLPPDLAPRARQDALRAVLTDPKRPTVLILDDVQWADHASVDLALHLLREPGGAGLAVVFTARSTEDALGSVRRLQETLARENLGTPLPLPPLAEDAVEALAFELGRDDLNAGELHRLSGGNPFFLLELLRAAPGTPPERIGTFLSARLSALDELERQVLGALAVLGDGQGLSVLRRTSGRSEAELDAALDSLRATAWVRLEEDGAHFAHDLTRQVMLHDLSPSRCALLHLRAARALGTRPILAGPHYWQSRGAWDEDDHADAHAALLATGANYALRGDLDGGLVWFDHAQEAFTDPARRGQTLVERARVLERYGRIEESLTALDSADLLLQGGDVVQKAAAQVMRAQLLAMKLGRLDEAQTISERVLKDIEGREGVAVSLVRSDALNVKGWVLQQRRDWQLARRAFEESLAIRTTLQDFSRMAASLSNLGPVLWRLKDAQAEPTFQQCIELCERNGDLVVSARAKHNLAHMYLESGETAVSVPLFQQAYIDQKNCGDAFSMSLTLVNIGAAEFFEGHYSTARDYYLQAMYDDAAPRRTVASKASLSALLNLAETYLSLGNVDSAVNTLDTLTIQLAEPSQWEHARSYFLFRADLAATQGDWNALQQAFHHAIDVTLHQAGEMEASRLSNQLDPSNRHPWTLWASALCGSDTTQLRHVLELPLEDWRRAYLFDALAKLDHQEAATHARAIRARFIQPPDPFLLAIQHS